MIYAPTSNEVWKRMSTNCRCYCKKPGWLTISTKVWFFNARNIHTQSISIQSVERKSGWFDLRLLQNKLWGVKHLKLKSEIKTTWDSSYRQSKAGWKDCSEWHGNELQIRIDLPFEQWACRRKTVYSHENVEDWREYSRKWHRCIWPLMELVLRRETQSRQISDAEWKKKHPTSFMTESSQA